ncbi:MAG TPA: hypothetical protein PLM93_09960 [Sulfuricurvum sp.]|nr:MAG: hypothetical protein B7Y30_03590 [Campylobacterales bacterium 16-40-21]OZA02593.1 MAG: hypothetical protein B7X89_08620 [Sulfuricurvum sp. 17-40-25]HQS67493.1 hypothetical protein [Sulfuricurvum sp.]HQT36333.1 hypothetical protein [Sulfuricurvum sp.]
MAKRKTDPMKGLTQLNILYIDLDTLIKTVVEEEKPLGDYRHLGVRLIDHREGYSDKLLSLSHVMYHTVILKNPPSDGSPMRVFVDESTYDDNRKNAINGMIRALADKSALSKARKTDIIGGMMTALLWLYNENIALPKSLDEARKAFVKYKEELNKSVKASELLQSSAVIRLPGLLRLLSGMLKIDEAKITEDIGLILESKKRTNAYNNTAAFSQEEMSHAFSFYYHLFDQVADFLLECKPYPHIIKLPLGNATLLPNAQQGGSMIALGYGQRRKGDAAVDYTTGHILSDNDIEAVISNLKVKNTARSDIKRKRAKLLEKLELVNGMPNHPVRLALGKKAMEAWFMCMLFIAPFNDATLATMEWNDTDEFEIERAENKEFRAIKYRAQNKPVRFEISAAFMDSFRKFLKLRRLILDGYSFQYLFFGGVGKDAFLTKNQQDGRYGSSLAGSFIRNLDSTLPRITSRNSRKDAGRDGLSSHGLQVALSILQNNKATFLKHYNGQTAEEMASQVHNFLENVHGIVNGGPIKPEQESAIGGCGYEANPEPKTISEESPVQADCNDQKSCIFCIHFRTYPEKEQIRKLQSLKYIIKNIAYPRAEDDKHYNEAMGPWLIRIDALFSVMNEEEYGAYKIIEEVGTEVFDEGMLSPYWLDWVQLFEDLGRFA